MKPSNDDDDPLRSLVQELGREAERRAPAFPTVWRAALQQQAVSGARTGSPAWWATVGALLMACAMEIFMMVHHTTPFPRTAPPRAEAGPEMGHAAESAAPTDFLLAGQEAPEGARVEKLSREIQDLLQP